MAVALVVCAAVTAVSAWAIVASPLSRRLLDHPNSRSLHERPTPRGGGFAVWTGVVVGAAWAVPWTLAGPPGVVWGALGGATVLVAVGLLDDRRGVTPLTRLAIQAATVIAFVRSSGLAFDRFDAFGFTWSFGPAGAPLVVLAALWMANLYNFMDGMDGFAGSMTLWGFSTLAWIAWRSGPPELAAAAALAAVAAAGFLLFNWPPARIFLGDSGSVPLGFLAAAIGAWGAARHVWSVTIPVIAFAPFIIDATATLVGRLLGGERVWEGHRTHVYQRLVVAGLGHRRVLGFEIAWMGVSAAAAIWAHAGGPHAEVVAMLIVMAAYLALRRAATVMEARNSVARQSR
jgi:UDP-N-acetylmuramyl pentapeptide phosphotransferase/UDP-N-acetylglucosamine-1-phosphate transferase